MNMGCFPRLFVFLLALVIAVSFAGCDIDLPGFGGAFSYGEPAGNEAVSDKVIYGEGSSDEIGGGSFVIGGDGQISIGGGDKDFASLVNEDGCVVFDMLMSSEGILQEGELAIPAHPDGTLMLPYDYQIIKSPDGKLILFVKDLGEVLPDDEPVDDGGYKLPNGDSVNPDYVVELDDGTVYIDYNITNTFMYGASRTYILDDQNYALVGFFDDQFNVLTSDDASYADAIFLEWDADTNYYNDIMIKKDRYRLEDQFLLSTKEYVYDNDGGDSLVLVAANGKEYDSYEQRYDYTYYEYGVRVADAYNFPTKEIRYEGNTNNTIIHYESTYNEYCTLINWKQIDENGVVYWEVNYAGDGSSRILNTAERRPWEGYEIYTEYEDGVKKIAHQTFKNCPGMKDGTKYVTYYTDDIATHYDEFDPNGVLLRTVYYDEEFNQERIVYYDKDGNITKEVNYD